MCAERSELIRSVTLESTGPVSRRGKRAGHATLILALIALGLFVHRENFTYGLVGNDTYPQILTSRVESIADFWDNFREPLAQGYLAASFYRPVQSFSIALDEALWGLKPAGYQLSTMAVFAACIALLYLTIRKLVGSNAWLAPVVGTLFFVLHPTLLTVLPAPCRRAELFVSVFLLAALLVLPIGPGRRLGARFILAGLFVLLASASKEVGVIGCGLVFLHQLCFAFERRFGRSLRRAVLAALPALVGAALYLVARTIVLGGLGGYYFKDSEPFFDLLPRWCAQLAVDALCPWAFLEGRTPLQLALVSLTLVTLLTIVFAVAGLCSTAPRMQRVGRLFVIAAAWIVPLVLVLGLNQLYGPWYALVPVVGLTVVVAGLARGIRLVIAGRFLVRLLSVVSVVGLAVAVVIPLRASPLFVEYPHWRIATELLDQAQMQIDERLGHARDGERVSVRIPVRVTPRAPERRPYEPSGDGPRVLGVVVFKYEGVVCWLKLRYPDRNIRVVWDAAPPLPQAREDEVLLLAYPDRSAVR